MTIEELKQEIINYISWMEETNQEETPLYEALNQKECESCMPKGTTRRASADELILLCLLKNYKKDYNEKV